MTRRTHDANDIQPSQWYTILVSLSVSGLCPRWRRRQARRGRFFSRTGAAALGQRRDAAFPVMGRSFGANEAAPARLYRGVCKTVKYAKGVMKAVMPFAL